MWGGLVSRATVANRRQPVERGKGRLPTGLQDAILPHGTRRRTKYVHNE